MNTRSQPSRNPWKWLRKIGFCILIIIWLLLTINILWPVISNISNSSSSPIQQETESVNYLIIAPRGLEKSASAWADYRKSSGYQTQVILLTPNQAMAEGIRDLVLKMYAKNGKPHPFYVLLVGHAHPFSSHPVAYLPAAHFTVSPNQSVGYGNDPIASDDGYASVNSSTVPNHSLLITIGRIPARTEEEGLRLLERTKFYEETPPSGEGRARIELVTSNAGFGAQYDPIFDWALKMLIHNLLPDEYRWHMLNGNANSPHSYPIYNFPNEVARRLDSRALTMVYIGHGEPDMLCCAYSKGGIPGRILSLEDTRLIQNANASLGIFTACSAGTYDLAGDELSVVEAIYLTPGGPVATYSSSAWINGTMNGRLIIDLFEALLIERASTIGEWVNRIEIWSESRSNPHLTSAMLKTLIPMIGGVYQENPLLSPTESHLELDIQHATYNLFGDPALRIAYPETSMEISPDWAWHPWVGSLAFHGSSDLPAGQRVLISLETLPGEWISGEDIPIGTIDQYLEANDLVIQEVNALVENSGEFTGKIDIPQDTPGGKYLLRAVAVQDDDTYAAAHPVYVGWSSTLEIFSSAIFWWSVISILLLVKFLKIRQSHKRASEEVQQLNVEG